MREAILSRAEHALNQFRRVLGVRGTNFCAYSASGKM
jgi:hypothetical protein